MEWHEANIGGTLFGGAYSDYAWFRAVETTPLLQDVKGLSAARIAPGLPPQPVRVADTVERSAVPPPEAQLVPLARLGRLEGDLTGRDAPPDGDGVHSEGGDLVVAP